VGKPPSYGGQASRPSACLRVRHQRSPPPTAPAFYIRPRLFAVAVVHIACLRVRRPLRRASPPSQPARLRGSDTSGRPPPCLPACVSGGANRQPPSYGGQAPRGQTSAAIPRLPAGQTPPPCGGQAPPPAPRGQTSVAISRIPSGGQASRPSACLRVRHQRSPTSLPACGSDTNHTAPSIAGKPPPPHRGVRHQRSPPPPAPALYIHPRLFAVAVVHCLPAGQTPLAADKPSDRGVRHQSQSAASLAADRAFASACL
jgi:hypothetical protein